MVDPHLRLAEEVWSKCLDFSRVICGVSRQIPRVQALIFHGLGKACVTLFIPVLPVPIIVRSCPVVLDFPFLGKFPFKLNQPKMDTLLFHGHWASE